MLFKRLNVAEKWQYISQLKVGTFAFFLDQASLFDFFWGGGYQVHFLNHSLYAKKLKLKIKNGI